jgi:hypothetical protein
MSLYPIVYELPDEQLIKHLEEQHPEDLAMVFTEGHRRFSSRRTWDVYHDHWLHRAKPGEPTHQHAGYLWTGWERETVKVVPGWKQMTRCTCLHPPSHQADCPGRQGVVVLGEDNAGPNAREKMWKALDQRTDGLLDKTFEDMKEARAEAATLAWCLALLDNPSAPDPEAVRKEAMRRRKERKK